MIKKNNKIKDIYFIIPGFLGNFSEHLPCELNKFLVSKKRHVEKCVFQGYEKGSVSIDSLDEIINKALLDFSRLRKLNPQAHIIVVVHSQGCAVIAKIISKFDANVSFIFLAPVVYLNELVTSRVPRDILQRIDDGEFVKCELAQNKFRIIDRTWVDSYRNFSVDEKGLKNAKQKCLVVRSFDDYIPSKHAEFFVKNLNKVSFKEIEGDHIFKNPEDSFEKLVKEMMDWIDEIH